MPGVRDGDPGTKAMQAETHYATILFADLCQSTKLYEYLGDKNALELVTMTLGLLEEVVAKYEGRVIKTIGDELMCYFESPTQAFAASCGMQESITTNPFLGGHNISVHIGFHYGEVIPKDNDVFGDAVNVAARAVRVAGFDEIITTRETVDHIVGELDWRTRYIGKLNVQGKEQKIDFFEVLWQSENLTLTMPKTFNLPVKDSFETCALLEFGDQVIVVGPERSVVHIGRDEGNDIVLPTQYVSRRHASVRFQNNKFFLSDFSSNGTFLYVKDERNVFVHRDEVLILGSGVISLGREMSRAGSELVRFQIT